MPGTAMDLYGMALPMPCGWPGVFQLIVRIVYSACRPARQSGKSCTQVRSERLLSTTNASFFSSFSPSCLRLAFCSSPRLPLVKGHSLALLSQSASHIVDLFHAFGVKEGDSCQCLVCLYLSNSSWSDYFGAFPSRSREFCQRTPSLRITSPRPRPRPSSHPFAAPKSHFPRHL